MHQISRRVFTSRVVAGTAVFAIAQFGVRPAAAAADALIEESDPQAAALGYKADARQVDAKKFPQHAAMQTCGNCSLYAGSDATGACAVFPGKTVARAGWCTAWTAR